MTHARGGVKYYEGVICFKIIFEVFAAYKYKAILLQFRQYEPVLLYYLLHIKVSCDEGPPVV